MPVAELIMGLAFDARLLGVSYETIRRGLNTLEKLG